MIVVCAVGVATVRGVAGLSEGGEAALLDLGEAFGVGDELLFGEVELGEAQGAADVVADVVGEEESDAFDAQVALAVLGAAGGVDLRVGVEVADALDVDYDELVA